MRNPTTPSAARKEASGTFRQKSLSEQVADALRRDIASGAQSNPLPGEGSLSERYGVSRPTLRLAVHQLAAQGVLAPSKGRRTRIVSIHAADRRSSVCFVFCQPRDAPGALSGTIVEELKFRFTAEGMRWDSVYDARLTSARPERRLARMAEIAGGNRVHVLISPPEPVQRWFARSGAPVLILGSCYPGVDLPSLDIDYRAIGRHAAATLLRHGHRRMLLVIPSETRPGVTATEQGMRDALGSTPEASLRILRWNRSRRFVTRLRNILNADDAPTACLACRVEVALSVLAAAQDAGKPVPRDLTLICRDHHPVLDQSLPEISRYTWNVSSAARKAAAIVRSLIQGGNAAGRSSLIMPEFVRGETLGWFRGTG